MKSRSKTCPDCRSDRTKRNGVRVNGEVQQYLCHNCGHQWAEFQDPLVAMLRGIGIDVRRHGILKAVVRFVRGDTMSEIERKTGVKSETLKRFLEIVRDQGLEEYLDDLLERETRLGRSYRDDLKTFWAECEMIPNPYWARGQDLHWVREQAKSKHQRNAAGTA